MAINFPDTPNEGDVHVVGTRSWTWDGTAWTSNTSRDYINSISETEPTNPVAGDTWFKSSTGQIFIYYDSYWIETGVAGPRGPAGTDGTDASLTRSIRTESANTTLLAADANQMLRFTGTDLQTLTIPDVLSVGESVQIVQDNTGQIEFSSGSGVILLSDSGEFGSNGQNTKVDLVCVGAGEYRLYGELVAVVLPSFNVEYLVVAGGGSGGTLGGDGGGGGAGGYRSSVSGESSGGGASAESVLTLQTTTNYTVTVGGGGAGGSSARANGTNSVFDTITSIGGGAGGVGNDSGSAGNGNTGGSGGGHGGDGNDSTGAAGTAGQGFAGGGSAGGAAYDGGGGGGAGEIGSTGQQRTTSNGVGGNGVQSSITGTATYRAGGGGGGTDSSSIGVRDGGLGGGGYGGSGPSSAFNDGESGTANTGGGGGAGGEGGANGSGGSGVVILRYPSEYSIAIGAGLTGTTSTVGANKVTEITAGTGNISFS